MHVAVNWLQRAKTGKWWGPKNPVEAISLKSKIQCNAIPSFAPGAYQIIAILLWIASNARGNAANLKIASHHTQLLHLLSWPMHTAAPPTRHQALCPLKNVRFEKGKFQFYLVGLWLQLLLARFRIFWTKMHSCTLLETQCKQPIKSTCFFCACAPHSAHICCGPKCAHNNDDEILSASNSWNNRTFKSNKHEF